MLLFHVLMTGPMTLQHNTKYKVNKSQMMRRYKTLTNKVTSFLHLVCSPILMEILVLTTLGHFSCLDLLTLDNRTFFLLTIIMYWDKKCILLLLNITHSTQHNVKPNCVILECAFVCLSGLIIRIPCSLRRTQ